MKYLLRKDLPFLKAGHVITKLDCKWVVDLGNCGHQSNGYVEFKPHEYLLITDIINNNSWMQPLGAKTIAATQLLAEIV